MKLTAFQFAGIVAFALVMGMATPALHAQGDHAAVADSADLAMRDVKTTTEDSASSNTAGRVMESAEDVRPLGIGESVPAITLMNLVGKKVNLAEISKNGPCILIFYRGGWCPFCTEHLAEVGLIREQLTEEGFEIYGVSPDLPQRGNDTATSHGLRFELLSDPSAEAIKAFGLAFRVDNPTVIRYRGMGIDLEKSSGKAHHILPVPAAYVIDGDGKIVFAHWESDYRSRIDPQELLDSARRAKSKGVD